MKRIFITILSISLILLLCGWFQRLVAYDGTYQGRIVDVETREPLEGVVILGVWYTETPSPGGGVQHYYDAQEAVTDKNGDFSIPGQGIKVVTNLLPMRPIIFKAGYEYLEFFWHTLEKSQGRLMKVTWEGKIPVIPLKKLTPEQRYSPRYDPRYSPPGPPSDAPYEKVKFLLKEINKDRIERGLKPLTEWGGVKL